MKDKIIHIEPIDSNGNWHGYQEWYIDDRLWMRGISKHGLGTGYFEWHIYHLVPKSTSFYIR